MDCWSLACHGYADPWARRNQRHELICQTWSWNNGGTPFGTAPISFWIWLRQINAAIHLRMAVSDQIVDRRPKVAFGLLTRDRLIAIAARRCDP